MSALVLLFSSCGSDDGGDATGGNVLIKKTIENGPEGQYITVATYNGTKLVKLTSNDGEVVEFTYTGDDITKMVYKVDGAIEQEERYTYNSEGKMATHISLDHDMQWGSKEVFTYNSDNVVTVDNFSGDLESQENEDGTNTITFVNGEVSQIVTPFDTITFTYDNKHNPFKNITGFSKISYADQGASGILHNVLSESSSNGGGSTYTYTYNSSDYPTQVVEDWDGETYTTEFIYN